MRRNIAVILAGGKSVRFGLDKPKQFIKVAGKLVIEHTLDVFQKHELIDEIAVVVDKKYFDLIEQLVDKNGYSKIKKILSGGRERYESSLSAIYAYKEEKEEVNLIFHDSVRPLVSQKIIEECIKKLEEYNAVDVAINSSDTIIEVEKNLIRNIPDRNKLNRGQTPQAFKLATIYEAYERAMQDPDFKTTDDCGVVKKYLPEEKIFVVKGEEKNIKLTYIEDLYLLEKLIQIKSITDIGSMPLSALSEKVIVILGGNSGIGEAISKLARSINMKVYCYSKRNNIDIKKATDIRQIFQEVYEKENIIHYIINTAGILYKNSFLNMSYEEIFETVDVNYKGSIIVAKESFKYLKESNGSLIFFTSSSYTRGRAFYGVYSSSKSAIVNLTQALSEEWYEFGIKVNCINPERTQTPMRIKNFGFEAPDTLLSPETVAKTTLKSLLSHMSGEIIDVKIR